MKGVFRLFKVSRIDVATGEPVVILCKEDASEMGVHPLDRIMIKNPETDEQISAVVNVSDNHLPKGTIGMFKDVIQAVDLKDGTVLVALSEKPESVTYIKEKMDGKKLDGYKINKIVEDIKYNRLSKIEMTGFMSGVYIRGFDIDESYEMAKSIANSGKKLELDIQGMIVDKHSIGGINGRATMMVVPIIASTGLYMPKTSSRAIASAAGTADSMEVLANVSLSLDKITHIVKEAHGVIAWGGGVALAPVDDKMIKVEYPLSLDPHGQVIASVLAKKYCVGAQKLIIDLPVGKELKVKTLADAEALANDFVLVGRKLGMDVKALITNGAQPSGIAFGPALEAKHVLEILEGKIKDTLYDKATELAGKLLEMGGKASIGEGATMAKKIVDSGQALNKFKQIIDLQGKIVNNSKDVPIGQYSIDVLADKEGAVSELSIKRLVELTRYAGAPHDKGAGVILKVKQNDRINKGDLLFTIYSENKEKLAMAEEYAKKSQPVILQTMVLEEI